MIIYLRVVPGFWVAVEEARRPELRSHPVILGGVSQGRGAVREANLTAQRCGVQSGMTLAQARQYCPDGIFLTPDLPHYEARWGEICSILGAYTPLVEPLEMGQAVCDLSGCERQWGGISRAAYAIAGEIRQCGIMPWLGVASNRLVAQLASTTVGPDGITVVERGQERAFLADLPLTSLPDVDPRMALTFQVLGLRTIGQLAALPASAVRQRFGREGERLHRWARGIDDRPVVPPPVEPSVSVRHECEDGSPEDVMAALPDLAERCAAELRSRHLAGTLLTLRLEPAGDAPAAAPQQPAHWLSQGGPALGPAPTPEARSMTSEGVFPVAYRIHSMLPQPGYQEGMPWAPEHPPPVQVSDEDSAGAEAQHSRGQRSNAAELRRVSSVATIGTESRGDLCSPVGGDLRTLGGESPRPTSGLTSIGSGGREHGGRTQVAPTPVYPAQEGGSKALAAQQAYGIVHSRIVRTPVDTAQPLVEWAQGLLLRVWPKKDGKPLPLAALSLKVSQFERPRQLAFAELNRLDQCGGLRGMDPARLRALLQQEETLAARYGDASFRHVSYLNPSSVLAERRFRWSSGLPGRDGVSGISRMKPRSRQRAGSA